MDFLRRFFLLIGFGLLALQAEGQTMVDPLSQLPADPAWVGPGLRLSPALVRPVGADRQRPAFNESDKFVSDGDENVSLTGHASTRRQDVILKADVIDYNKQSGTMDARGHGRLIRDGSTIVGPEIHYNTDNGTGTVNQPNFWLETGGSGIGSWADIFSRSQMSLTDVTYSGCPCPNPAWYMQMDSLDLDFDNNEGVAHNGVLYFKDVPILASPYLTFPIKKERKSGFLIPTFGSTTTTGLDYTQPYYFNLAPNYDATFVSRTMSKRGEQIGGEVRWLDSFDGTGVYAPGAYVAGRRVTEFATTLYDRAELSATYLNNDSLTQTSRWLYSTSGYKSLDRGFYASWAATGVSDPNYFSDFSVIGANQIPTTILPRMGMAGWTDGYWNASVQYLTYQTLSSVSNPVVAPYNKVPEIVLTGSLFNWHGFDLQTENSATQFDLTNGPGVTNYSSAPVGQRYRSYTQISYPVIQPGWYVTPKLSLFGSQYSTDWKALTGSYGQSSNSLMLPLASFDAGLKFERDATLFNNPATQTFEPRLYYLYVPYQDQSQFPVYDTTLADFSFSQAFQENIFSGGWDRVANANQLTAGLTTRYLDADTGFERLTFSFGQQFYFDSQKVLLPNEVPRTNATSAMIFESTAGWTDKLNTVATVQYDPNSGIFDRTQLSVRWKPQRQSMIMASWRYQTTPTATSIYQTQGQNQISVSAQWPLTKHWYTVGRVDYSFVNNPSSYQLPGFTQMLAGIEYKSDCCWAARAVLQRYAVNPLLNTTDTSTVVSGANSYNTALFLQLELSGLGALGSNPMGLIAKSVIGYENPVPVVPNVSKFERYE